MFNVNLGTIGGQAPARPLSPPLRHNIQQNYQHKKALAWVHKYMIYRLLQKPFWPMRHGEPLQTISLKFAKHQLLKFHILKKIAENDGPRWKSAPMSLALLLAAPWKMAPFASLALGSLETLTINYECQIKSVYKTNFRTPALGTLENLMRSLTV